MTGRFDLSFPFLALSRRPALCRRTLRRGVCLALALCLLASAAGAGEAKPSLRSRKMAPSEAAGIDLAIESHATDIGREGASASAPRVAAKKAASKRAKPAVRRPSPQRAAKPARKVVVKPERKESPSGSALEVANERMKRGDWKGAVAAYDKILQKEPNDREALYGKVYALDQDGSDGALEKLDAMAARRYEAFAPLHAARARILTRQNDTLEALEAWKKALRLDPENADYRLGLAVLTDRLGKEAEALRLYGAVPHLSEEAKARRDYLSGRSSR